MPPPIHEIPADELPQECPRCAGTIAESGREYVAVNHFAKGKGSSIFERIIRGLRRIKGIKVGPLGVELETGKPD